MRVHATFQTRYRGLLRWVRDRAPLLFGGPGAEADSDLVSSRALAEACARNICWLIDEAAVRGGVLGLRGWALVTVGLPSDVRFQVNGVPFTRVRFPIADPALGAHFYGVANASSARFTCEIDLADVPEGPYFRFEFVQGGDVAKARRTAWWYPSRSQSDTLSVERISRVVGSSDAFSFELGGATLFHRIQDYLLSRFQLRYEDMGAILDWGCGAGRLLSQFAEVKGPEVWGGDVDHDNLTYCHGRFPFARCRVFPLLPPTEIADATFDLILGISVCSHLSEEHQLRWLAELRRIARPGGLVLLSVQGRSQTALYRESPELMRRVERTGFVVKGVNPRINDMLGARSYYLDVIQTRTHIGEHWGREFEVLEFIDGMAANQDLVVMRAPAAAHAAVSTPSRS